MKIRYLKLINFRNYHSLELELNPGINIFIGENGVGKTNILESIYVLALTKTNRDNIDSEMINFNEEYLKIEGKITSGDLIKSKEVDIYKNKKQLYINGKEIRRHRDYVKDFSVISFSPKDLNIISGSPSIRRNLLNIDLSQIKNNYISYLNEYNSILKMRNEYLKRMNLNGFTDERYLEILNNELINKAVKIYEYRLDFIDKINKLLPNIFKKISNLEGLIIKYNNTIGIENFNEEEIVKKMKSKYTKNLNFELLQGATTIGPHRDDFSFMQNDIDMKNFASEGQQRLAIIALKIAEIHVFKEELNEYPVLLLDDIFSELDIKKRNKIIKYLDDNIQTIITTTDINDINKEIVEKASVYTVKKDRITKKGKMRNGRK